MSPYHPFVTSHHLPYKTEEEENETEKKPCNKLHPSIPFHKEPAKGEKEKRKVFEDTCMQEGSK